MRRLVIAALSLLALLLGSSSAQAITWNGEPDGTEHPHVVTLLFEQNGAFYSCSGTLLSPTVVLTAGHCVEDGNGEPNDRTYVSNSPEPLSDYEGGGLSNYLESSEQWVSGEAIAHPEYDNFSGFPNTYDIGLVVLEEPGIDTGGVYGQLPDEGMLDALATKKGATTQRQVKLVGYGMQGTVPTAMVVYERYQGIATITGLNRSSITGSQSLQLTNAPGKGTGGSGTCYGDSGGPAFWIDPVTGEETTIVVAVTSFGITGGQCVGTGYSFRTDTTWAQEFVDEYL
ncbi:trypsin-like serine protease [Kocuria sp. M4R2S49]|uniref:trypsin-like serine protease n=1 Tax=Kocuria rhizosphaericola TaxID=3376284 RepID=UPI00379ACD79